MSTLQTFIDAVASPLLTEQIGWLLIHSLWQFTIIAIIAAALVRMLRRSSSNTQYWMLSTALFAMVLSPIVTIAFIAPSEHSAGVQNSSPNSIAVSPADRADLPAYPALVIEGTPDQHLDSDKADAVDRPSNGLQTARDASSPEQWLHLIANMVAPWLNAIVLGWCVGVVCFSLRPIISWFNVRRLCRVGVSQPPESLMAMLDKLKQRLDVRASVRLLQSSVVEAPIVVGCFRCVILLPTALVANLPISQLEAIIAHELSHVRRYDYLVNLLQTLIETLFFYHPAVWWLSNRIRIERENCCDDLVVANSISKVDYGRALLAIEESRQRESLLALSAKGGSLLARVQRMIAEPTRDTPRSGLGMIACLMFALVTTAAIWTSSAVGSSDDKKTDSASEANAYEFGPVSDGIQCRLISVSPDINVESPDVKQVDTKFNQSNDVTFAVELKNVSDKAVDLVGIRYGDGYAPESQGKLATSMFAPQWFDFTFTDASGKEVARTRREFYNAWLMADGASVHTLQPNESLTVAIKPSEFLAPFNIDLPPGSYNAVVRYRGPDDDVKANVRKHWPEKSILNAWSHSVTSNSAAFTIDQPAEGARREDLVWGPTVAGLQAAVEFKLAKDVKGNPHIPPGILAGSSYHSVIHVRNASDKTITLVSETGRQGDEIAVTDAEGNKVEVPNAFYTGWPIDVLWTLQPGQEAELPILTPSLSLDKVGKYSVRYTLRFNSRQMKDAAGNVTFPRPGDYKEDLETGVATLYLTDKLAEAPSNTLTNAIVDSKVSEPYRLADHWIVEDVRWIDKELMTVSLQGGVNVRRWNVSSRNLISEIKLQSDQHGRAVKQGTLKISRNGKRVIGVTDDYVGLWDASSGELLRKLAIPKKEWEYDTVRCLDCSEDGSLIVAGLGTTYDRLTRGYDGTGILWDTEAGKVLLQFTHKLGFYFSDIAMSADGKRCVTCGEQGNVAMWDLSTGRMMHDLSSAINDWKSPNAELITTNLIRSVAISPDNQTAAIGGTYGVRLFDIASGKMLRTIDAPYRYSSFQPRIVFSSDAAMLARFGTSAGEKSYVIPIWSVASGETQYQLECDATTGDFSSNGRLLATAESDFYEAVSVWLLAGERYLRAEMNPVAYERINRVEENTHVKGESAKQFAEKWKPRWGEARNGIEYGIAFTTAKNQYAAGDQLQMAAFLRNASGKEIQIDLRPDMFGNTPTIVDAEGTLAELSKLNLLNSVSHYRDTLQPGEIFGPLYLCVGIGENPKPNQQVWTPYWKSPKGGSYDLTHRVNVYTSSPQTKSATDSADWKSAEVTSGSLGFKIDPQASLQSSLHIDVPKLDGAELTSAFNFNVGLTR